MWIGCGKKKMDLCEAIFHVVKSDYLKVLFVYLSAPDEPLWCSGELPYYFIGDDGVALYYWGDLFAS